MRVGALSDSTATMQTSFRIPSRTRVLAMLAAAGCIVAIAACGHAPTAGPDSTGAAGKDDDPWVTRGSVSGGPIVGNPIGPYSPRR